MNYKIPFILPIKTLMAVALLTACSSVLTSSRPPPDIAPCPPPPNIVLSLNETVRYYTCLNSLSAPDVMREFNAASQRFSETGSNSDRIKLAILLSLPDTSFHNTAVALNLLKAVPDEPPSSSSDLYNLARLLSMLLAEQQRVDDTLNDLAKALAAEKTHSEFLQNKIDAVKDLEINLIHRDQP